MSKSSHLQKAVEIASKVADMASDSLRGLEAAIATWPGEYQAIMWDAVAAIAASRAAEAKNKP